MNLVQDVRFGLRLLVKSPGYSLVVIAALAAGIGVNTAVFTLVNAVLFKGLPFDRPHEILHLTSNNRVKGRENINVSYPDFRDWQAQSKVFSGLAAFQFAGASLTDAPAGPDRFNGARMSANAFSLIGQKVMLGRDFLPGEDKPEAQPVAILGYSIWKNRYGGDPNILGRVIRVNDTATTVIGVMPEGMKFPMNEEIWTPLVPTAELEKRETRYLHVFGRLKPGETLASARAELDIVAKRLEKEYGSSNQGVGVLIRTFNEAFNGGEIRTVFLAMMGAVGFVLLISCANVANLQLSRGTTRLREVSIRTALGASRWRVIRQLLVESILLSLIGGAVGIGLAKAGTSAFDLAVANVGKPYWIRFDMDYAVFAYLAAICIAAGVISGLLPALAASRVDLNTTLKEGGRGSAGTGRSGWISGALVTAEFALSMVLLIGAGLMIRSLLNTYDVVARFDLDRTLTGRLAMPATQWKDEANRAEFWDRLLPRLRTVSGLEKVALASSLPGSGAMDWEFEIEGQPAPDQGRAPSVSGVVVTPGYFDTVGVRVLRGRTFNEADGHKGKEAVIINQRFAARFFPREDPLGRHIRLVEETAQPWMTVVGVSEDVAQDQASVDIEPVAYVPYRQKPLGRAMLIARSAGAASLVAPALRKEIYAYSADLPLMQAQSLRDAYAQSRWPFRVFGTVFAVFAVIALALAAMGLFSVVAYSVGRRTQEIGLRMALGAPVSSVHRLVLKGAAMQLGIGMVIGAAGALAVTRLIKSVLLRVSPTDPLTFIAVPVLLAAVGVAACWLPARRAARIDPLVALRYE